MEAAPLPSARRAARLSRSHGLYRVAAIVALMSAIYGFWRVFVQRGWTPGLFWEIIFPLLVLRLALTLYQRSRRALDLHRAAEAAGENLSRPALSRGESHAP